MEFPDEFPFWGHDDAAVGHHAVHVQYDNAYARYIFFEVSHISVLIF
jgi:hypothetical protein